MIGEEEGGGTDGRSGHVRRTGGGGGSRFCKRWSVRFRAQPAERVGAVPGAEKYTVFAISDGATRGRSYSWVLTAKRSTSLKAAAQRPAQFPFLLKAAHAPTPHEHLIASSLLLPNPQRLNPSLAPPSPISQAPPNTPSQPPPPILPPPHAQ